MLNRTSVFEENLPSIRIDLKRQSLRVLLSTDFEHTYPVSTAAGGVGNQIGSYCTPIGRHRIRLKIGDDYPSGAVFRRRRFTGEVFNQDLAQRHPGRDWILSRILWIEGLEKGINRGGALDTLRRYIYIHGTSDEHLIGTACSHGCIRMRNDDIIELFELVHPGTLVYIE